MFRRCQLATVTGCIIVDGKLPLLLGKTPAVTSVSALRRALLGQGMGQYRTPPTSYEFRLGPRSHLIDPRRHKSRRIPSRGDILSTDI